MQSMNYSKHALYRSLTKTEKKFLNEQMARMKKDFRSREQDEEFLKKVAGFKNHAILTQLFLNADENGSIDENAQPVDPKDKNDNVSPVPSKERQSKDIYGKGAYRRWNRKELIFKDGEKEMVKIKLVVYEIVKEGSKFRLITPGQKQLPLKSEKKNVANAKVKAKEVGTKRTKTSK